ncbi:hypothetical protein CDAR_493251 [Caerostris darwini]|uniref:Uncharacterized protein n=1 Tax=Caerostris darwini TaxID=1538125 RepID=A0AAV4NUI6_9ARAC|nr:hypothetical protein CDAR_493251 [Caerostris darwini]
MEMNQVIGLVICLHFIKKCKLHRGNSSLPICNSYFKAIKTKFSFLYSAVGGGRKLSCWGFAESQVKPRPKNRCSNVALGKCFPRINAPASQTITVRLNLPRMTL